MFHSLAEFFPVWEYESQATHTMLGGLTDASLAHLAYPGGRTIGRLAWHIAQTLPEMMARTGLHLTGVGEHDPVPVSAETIADGYRNASASLVAQLTAHWTDATLTELDDMYGEQWPRGRTLDVLIRHQAHHRGQLTILMRQAGLSVSGVYGPTREEWTSFGMDAPEV